MILLWKQNDTLSDDVSPVCTINFIATAGELVRKIIDDKSVKFFTNTLLLHPKKQEIKLKNCEYKEGQLYMKTSYEMILFADKKVKESINVFYHRTDISFWIYI